MKRWPGELLIGKPGLLCAVALLIASTGVAWLAHAATLTDDTAAVSLAIPVIPKATSGDQCVADTDLMRTDHMEMLSHQRDETVIDGMRQQPFSLVGCVNCHAQTAADGTAIRIDAEGQFCESCHTYAAVKIDCFSCHAAVPETAELTGFRHLPESPLSKMASVTGLYSIDSVRLTTPQKHDGKADEPTAK